MGLAICKKIVDNCGGTIDVFSAGENKGSTFSFSMKMLLPDGVRRSQHPEEEVKVARMAKKRLSVISEREHDHDSSRESLKEMTPEDQRSSVLDLKEDHELAADSDSEKASDLSLSWGEINLKETQPRQAEQS